MGSTNEERQHLNALIERAQCALTKSMALSAIDSALEITRGSAPSLRAGILIEHAITHLKNGSFVPAHISLLTLERDLEDALTDEQELLATLARGVLATCRGDSDEAVTLLESAEWPTPESFDAGFLLLANRNLEILENYSAAVVRDVMRLESVMNNTLAIDGGDCIRWWYEHAARQLAENLIPPERRRAQKSREAIAGVFDDAAAIGAALYRIQQRCDTLKVRRDDAFSLRFRAHMSAVRTRSSWNHKRLERLWRNVRPETLRYVEERLRRNIQEEEITIFFNADLVTISIRDALQTGFAIEMAADLAAEALSTESNERPDALPVPETARQIADLFDGFAANVERI